MRKTIKLFCIIFSLLLVSCSLMPDFGYDLDPKEGPQAGKGKPYTVRGQTYYPLLSEKGFKEEGIASWYGPNFHGKQTASGEIYHQHALTAAHKLLPLGSYVYVENLDNGKVVRVKINDRGPFAHGRIIDLSRNAAAKLDLLEKGVGRVRITYEKP